jgi:hypothetical protein
MRTSHCAQWYEDIRMRVLFLSNATHGSEWNIQAPPTKNVARIALGIPPTGAGGIYRKIVTRSQGTLASCAADLLFCSVGPLA